MKKALELKVRLSYKMSCLSSNGQHDALMNLSNRYDEAFSRWRNDIANAPEGSDNIYLSNYFRP